MCGVASVISVRESSKHSNSTSGDRNVRAGGITFPSRNLVEGKWQSKKPADVYLYPFRIGRDHFDCAIYIPKLTRNQQTKNGDNMKKCAEQVGADDDG